MEAAADLRLSTSWQFYNFVGGAATGSVFPTTVRNPVSHEDYTLLVNFFLHFPSEEF